YGPSKADVARVTTFLKTHGIKVVGISANHVLIHTEASTENYEHALGIRINDYERNGRTFYSTMDSTKLPRKIASLMNGIMGLNLGVRMHSHLEKATARPGVKTVWPRQAPPPATTGAYLNQLQFAKAYD